MRISRLLLPLLVASLLLACGDGGVDSVSGGAPSDEALSAMNRGLAQLETFEYLPASVEFEQAVQAAPDWAAAKVNLSIALMNLQGKEEHARATKLLNQVLEREPLNPHANFMIGFMSRIDSRAEEAIPYFDRVLEVDPDDVGALFWKGMCLGDLGKHEEANALFNAAIKADPYLAAAYHARHSRLMLLGRPEEARKSRETSDRLRAPRGKAFPIQGTLITAMAYHEIGKYAMAIRDYEVSEPVDQAATIRSIRADAPALGDWSYGGGPGPEFSLFNIGSGTSDENNVLAHIGRIGPGVAVADIDGDGDTDVFLPAWGGAGRILLNDGRGEFSPADGSNGIDRECYAVSGVFFDADADGDQDLYLSCAGPNVFYRNRGDGTFEDRTEASGLSGRDDVVSISATPGDFDHEGDLDLFVANYCRTDDADLSGAPDELFQNNRDGTFKAIAAEYGVDGGDARSIGLLAIDLEKDQDTDLLVIRDKDAAALWLNERIWRFRAGELPPELTGTDPAWGVAAGDVDRDGFEEVLVFRGPGADPTLFRTDRMARLTAVPGAFAGVRWRTGAFLDADLDGRLDLVGDGMLALGADGLPFPGRAAKRDLPENARGVGFADFDGDGDLDRVTAASNVAALFLTEAPKDHHWLALALEGREALQPAAWSARTGPGQELELRAGRLWQPLRTRATTGFLSTIEAVARFGLGPHTMADMVRIVWPDRVLQVESEIPADQVKRIVELNRKPASCPMLFAWDGERFQFVSDFLGVGGLGFFLGPGLYGESDPDEFVWIGKWVKPIDDEIVLQVMEPLEEISYVDEATLLVVDHPAGMDVYPNERYVGEKALFPEARIYGVAEKVFPKAARDRFGKSVLDTILTVDRLYAPLTPDLRFPGVAQEHALTLDFTGRVPECADGDRLVLFLNGWIEYGYSNTFFAAWQAGVECAAPVLEVPDGQGGWKEVIRNMGCPAGLPKGMTVDVTGIVTAESPVFRIRTNLEVYWDQAFLGVDRAAGNITITRVSPKSAHLHDRGYPREFSPDGNQPLLYDYGIMDPGYTFKYFAGEYTKFGNVTPLVQSADDEYVIMAHGEELTLRYDTAEFPPLPEGFERTWILYAAGWCKDMDPYTAFPNTVGPLPFRGMSGYPYGDGEEYPGGAGWREKWNTRKVEPR